MVCARSREHDTMRSFGHVTSRQKGLLVCLAAALVTLAACAPQETAKAPAGIPVQVAPAVRGSIQHLVTVDAVVYARDQTTLTPKISAPVRRFLVNRGDRVHQGQLLAQL